MAQCCVLCHDSASDGLCPGCAADLALCATDAANSCPLCFRSVIGGAVCGVCQKTPPPFERLWASVYYDAPFNAVIHQWKHLADSSLSGLLTDTMLRHPPAWLAEESFDYVLAMPLSRARRLYRGFNQSEVLAERLAQHYGWTLLPHDAVFRADAPPQSTLKSDVRWRNVKNIFKPNKPLPSDCKVLLIDDVFTTGASLHELARTLKKSGVGRVCCWTLARAQMKN